MRFDRKTAAALLLLFLFSVLINAVFFNYAEAPVTYPDSESYIQFARSIRQGHLPDISWRTFIYPLYLSAFGMQNIKLSLYVMVVLGAIPILCMYGAEYSRLRTPCELFLNFMVVLPVVYFAKMVKNRFWSGIGSFSTSPYFTNESNKPT